MCEEEVWRPLGVCSEDEIAEYDALHDGVPAWMESAFWTWVEAEITEYRADIYDPEGIAHLNVPLMESMCQ